MKEEVFDVLIIGSGHAGGMAAKVLTEKGIRCLMLNAGPVADVNRDTERKPAYELPYQGIQAAGATRTCLPVQRIQRQRVGG